MTKVAISAVDYDNPIFIGSYLKHARNFLDFERKEYRLAVFNKESPIVIACNNVDFQQEFEESSGFVYWLTDWIEW